MSKPGAKADQPVRRLKIAVLSRVFATSGGGAERYSVALVEQLAGRHEIHVFAQTIEQAIAGVTFHRVPAPMRKPRWVNQLWYAAATWWATRRGFDVVHSHENTWHGQVQTVHVLPVRHNLFDQRHGWALLRRWAQVVTSPRLQVYLGLERARFAFRPGRQVVVTSESLRVIMGKVYKAASPMLRVLTPGVAVVAGAASPLQRQAARAARGLPAHGACLLFVGNDYRRKGLDSLLRALVMLPSDVVLAVVGHPGQQAEFQRQAAAAGLGGRVFFLGALKDMAVAYQAADGLVHPTLEDTFAMVVLEAMAHGLPVVVSAEAYCGIAGLLRDGVDALLLADPRDAAALADALRRLLADGPQRQRLLAASLVFARAHQWPMLARQQEEIYLAASA